MKGICEKGVKEIKIRKRMKHKKKLVLDCLTMKIKSPQSFETWELQTQ
jgi:hypothetical protein